MQAAKDASGLYERLLANAECQRANQPHEHRPADEREDAGQQEHAPATAKVRI